MEPLSAVLNRFDHGQAVLRFEGGQELTLPRRRLPKRAKEGSILRLEFYRAEDEAKRKEAIARYLLEEVLGPHD